MLLFKVINMIVPDNAKSILEYFLTQTDMSIPMIATRLKVSKRTLYRIMQGSKVSSEIELHVLCLFCRNQLFATAHDKITTHNSNYDNSFI